MTLFVTVGVALNLRGRAQKVRIKSTPSFLLLVPQSAIIVHGVATSYALDARVKRLMKQTLAWRNRDGQVWGMLEKRIGSTAQAREKFKTCLRVNPRNAKVYQVRYGSVLVRERLGNDPGTFLERYGNGHTLPQHRGAYTVPYTVCAIYYCSFFVVSPPLDLPSPNPFHSTRLPLLPPPPPRTLDRGNAVDKVYLQKPPEYCTFRTKDEPKA